MKLHSLLMLGALALPSLAYSAEEPLRATVDGISYQDVPEQGLMVTGSSLATLSIPETVTINDSIYPVTAIGQRAFSPTYNTKIGPLYEISIPSSVKTIGNDAFDGALLTKVSLSEGLEEIGWNAFRGCKYLKEISIPNTVKTLGSQAFYGSGLVSIYLGDGISKLEESLFMSCSSLEYVKLPSNLRTIDNNAFYGCKSLAEIKIPETVMSIDGWSFYGCERLQSIELPPMLVSVENYCFYNCKSLKYVNFPPELMTIKSCAFEGCDLLETVSLPNKVTNVGDCAFAKCKKLTEVFIPATISEVYYNCSVKDDKITNSRSAFAYCPKLTKVHVRSLTPRSFGVYQFVPPVKEEGVSYTLYVPAGMKEAYAAIDTYKNFDLIEEENIALGMESSRRIIAGTTVRLDVTPVPAVFPLGSLTWKSSNTAAATVDAYGNVTAVKPGNAIITASVKVEGKEISAHCSVEVMAEPTSSFVIQPVTLSVGSVASLPVEMVNEGEVVAFQCDIYLPEGMQFAKDEYGEYDFSYAGRESRTHILESRLQADGSVRVVGYSPNNSSYRDNQGTLFNIPVTLPSLMGDYEVRIANILVTDKSLQEQPLMDVTAKLFVGTALGGDANGDGRLTISDAAVASAFMLGEEPAGFNFSNADVVKDGNITLADISEIVNRVLGASAAAKSKVRRSHGVAFPTREGDRMSAQGITINPGDEVEVKVFFENADPFTSFHTEIILPEGLSFVDDEGEYFIDLSSRKHRTHTSACKLQEDGRLRALAYSSTNALFKGNDGHLFSFYVKAAPDFDPSRQSAIRFENNYVCNRNADDVFTDYDVNNCEAAVNLQTSVADAASDGWMVYAADGVLNVVAPQSCEVVLSDVSGAFRTLSLSAGHNSIEGLAPGIYFVAGHKVAVR